MTEREARPSCSGSFMEMCLFFAMLSLLWFPYIHLYLICSYSDYYVSVTVREPV